MRNRLLIAAPLLAVGLAGCLPSAGAAPAPSGPGQPVFVETIRQLTRVTNAPNGSLEYRVDFVDGCTEFTRLDAPVNRTITSPQYRGVLLDVTYATDGTIVAVARHTTGKATQSC